ncbi:MAG: HEAT repeat domain-containing protein [Catenulispora sp.]|nr:HEAT repeat domain-containing protein [Catenulispora sp.]
MTTDDPLAGLDDIAWDSLSHAYGSAEDVPDLLRALLSDDAEVRKEVMWALLSNIYHQGTRYEATSYAVPFLARLALNEATPERDHIVGLLSAIAIGFDAAYLPQGYDPDVDRQALAEVRTETPESWERKLDAWVAEESDEWQRKFRERMRPFKSLESTVRNAETVVRSYEAVRNELSALTGLLEVEDPGLRTEVAYLLSWFPEAAETSVPALIAMAGTETAPGPVATAIVALGLLGGPEVIPVVRPYAAGSEPVLRWAGAVALARLGAATPEVVANLAAATVEPPPDVTPPVPFLQGDYRGLAAKSLVTAAEIITPAILDAVLTGLSRSSEEGSFEITAATLRLTFPTGALDPLPPFDELTEPQRRVVRTLTQMGRSTWSWGNFTDILGDWGLPQNHDELCAYAGIPGPTP